MSRRSPDRDRDRDKDRGRERDREYSASSSYKSRPRRDYEPGEVSSRRDEGRREREREWEVERDPRVPPSVGSSRRARSPPSRNAERDREEVTQALDGFSRTMHSTLLSTSTHALAIQHLRRMESFPLPPSGIPNASLAEAQNRLRSAEVELGERMKDLYGTFDELMKRTLVSQPTRSSDRDKDSPKERERDTQRDRDRELSKSELDAIRERMRTLERRLDEVPPPPTPSTSTSTSRKGKEKEITEDGVEGKRSRAKALLENMLSRLEVVENIKDELDSRCNDLEDLVNSRVQDDMEITRLGNSKWKVFEDLRDPDGVIRGIKRKREEEEIPPPPEELPPPPPSSEFKGSTSSRSISNINTHNGPDPALTALQAQVTAMVNDRSEIAQLKAQVESLKSTVNSNSNSNPTIYTLQRQITSLQTELSELKEEQKKLDEDYKNKAAADTEALDKLKSHCGELIKSQMIQVVAKLANTNTSIPRTSPSNTTSRLPNINTNTNTNTSTITSNSKETTLEQINRLEQMKQQSTRQYQTQSGQGRPPTPGNQTHTLPSPRSGPSQLQPNPANGQVRPPQPPNSNPNTNINTNGQVRTTSQNQTQAQAQAQRPPQVPSQPQPQSQPQRPLQAQFHSQPQVTIASSNTGPAPPLAQPPNQNRPATTTPTLPSNPLPQQPPRPASADPLAPPSQPNQSRPTSSDQDQNQNKPYPQPQPQPQSQAQRQPISPIQQSRVFQFDKPSSQAIQIPSPGQKISVSGLTQVLQNSPPNSNPLADWVDQRLQHPPHPYPQPGPSTTASHMQQYHQQQQQQQQQQLQQTHDQHPPPPAQSSNPLNPLMQGHPAPPNQQIHPDGNSNTTGIRFPGIGTPVNYGAQGSGKLVQQMNNAMNQQPGPSTSNGQGQGPYYG